jgi:hypothetical protein
MQKSNRHDGANMEKRIGGGDDDQLFPFDEKFVQGAEIKEGSAEERLRSAGRASRQEALLQRLKEQAKAEVDEQASLERRARGSRRRIRVQICGCVVVFVALLGGLNALSRVAGKPTVSDAGSFRLWTVGLPPPHGGSTERLGHPPKGLAASDVYRFVATQPRAGSNPVAYDPCRELHYVVNSIDAPPNGIRYIQQSIAEVSKATGIQFVFDGETDERFEDKRAAFQPSRYGKKWAPLLIDWANPQIVSGLDGKVVGLGGSVSIAPAGLLTEYLYVTGEVALDTPAIREILRTPDGAAVVGGIILHELGHVMGLNHVEDPSQLMFKEAQAVTSYALGDQNGLARLGTGRCFPTV